MKCLFDIALAKRTTWGHVQHLELAARHDARGRWDRAPESVLTSQWFILLATVVAFNTVVYLGPTLAKLHSTAETIPPKPGASLAQSRWHRDR